MLWNGFPHHLQLIPHVVYIADKVRGLRLSVSTFKMHVSDVNPTAGSVNGRGGTSACIFEDEVHCGCSEMLLQHLALESSLGRRWVFPHTAKMQ